MDKTMDKYLEMLDLNQEFEINFDKIIQIHQETLISEQNKLNTQKINYVLADDDSYLDFDSLVQEHKDL